MAQKVFVSAEPLEYRIGYYLVVGLIVCLLNNNNRAHL
jgi:hypothetical protein